MSTDTGAITPTTPRELLIYTVDFLRDNPERHDQGQWMTDVVEAAAAVGPAADAVTVASAVLAPDNTCGTTGCVAGWGALFAGYHQLRDGYHEYVVDETGREHHMQAAARLAFDLPHDQASYLFDGMNDISNILDMLDALIADGPDADLEPFTERERWTWDEACEQHDEWLDTDGPIEIDGCTFYPSQVLREMSPADYDRRVTTYADQEGAIITD